MVVAADSNGSSSSNSSRSSSSSKRRRRKRETQRIKQKKEKKRNTKKEEGQSNIKRKEKSKNTDKTKQNKAKQNRPISQPKKFPQKNNHHEKKSTVTNLKCNVHNGVFVIKPFLKKKAKQTNKISKKENKAKQIKKPRPTKQAHNQPMIITVLTLDACFKFT